MRDLILAVSITVVSVVAMFNLEELPANVAHPGALETGIFLFFLNCLTWGLYFWNRNRKGGY